MFCSRMLSSFDGGISPNQPMDVEPPCSRVDVPVGDVEQALIIRAAV